LLVKRPDEIGGAEAETVHVILEDAGITLLEATAVEIIIDLEDQDYGGRGNSYPAAIFVHFSERRVILNVPVQQARPPTPRAGQTERLELAASEAPSRRA
jgi:hypothetical protein